MLKTQIDIAGAEAAAYIYDNDGDTYIISIPYINFSLEMNQALSRDDKEEEIIAHLFHLLDEDVCIRIAETLVNTTDKK